MVQEILNKINPRERLIGIGAIVLLVGWLFGVLLASVSWDLGAFGKSSVNVFSASGGTGIGYLAVLAAVAAIVVIYLRYAPNIKIEWPVPIPMILLGIAAVAGVVSLLLLLYNFQNSQDFNNAYGFAAVAGVNVPSWPITDWIAVLAMIVGAGLMCWGAYQEWLPTRTVNPNPTTPPTPPQA